MASTITLNTTGLIDQICRRTSRILRSSQDESLGLSRVSMVVETDITFTTEPQQELFERSLEDSVVGRETAVQCVSVRSWSRRVDGYLEVEVILKPSMINMPPP